MPDSSDGRQRHLTENELAELELMHREAIDNGQRHIDMDSSNAGRLLAEVRQARRLLSAPRWSGVITSVNEKGAPATRIGPAGHSVPDRDRAASDMLAALEARGEDHLSGGFCDSFHGNACTCGRDRDAAAIAAARAAGIEPTK